MDLYRNIRRRLESRFLKNGRIPGLLMLISSKNSEHDFLEQHINSIKHLSTTIVVDEAVYTIKPQSNYSGKKFKVAVVALYHSSRIVEADEDPKKYEELGYRVIEVPVEYETAFRQDINDALKDISGISSVSTNKLIPYPGKVMAVVDESRPNPMSLEQLVLGLDSVDRIQDYVRDINLLKKNVHLPRFVHVDIGLTGDALGMAIVHSDNLTTVSRYTPEGTIDQIEENTYKVDLLLSIKALSGSEVPLFKVREFLMWLSSAVGYKFQTISFDGYQSADSLQLLKVAGYNALQLSVDRTDVPYLNLRSCILDGRLNTYYHPILVEELTEIEHDKKAGKVDHPIEGTKDLADGLCGALYDAQQYYATINTVKTLQRSNVSNALGALQKLAKAKYVEKSLGGTTLRKEDQWLLEDYD